MKFRNVLLIIAFFALVSCVNYKAKVIYVCNGVTITRIDKNAETSFWYSTPEIKYAGRIWVSYSGIDSNFGAILMFDTISSSHKVVLLGCDGIFQSEDLDSTYFEYKEYDWDDQAINPFGVKNPKVKNYVFYKIKLSTRYEKEMHEKTLSTVDATYLINKNDWFVW